MNTAVVDDEKVILDQISGLVRKQMPDCCLDTYATGEEVLGAGKRLDTRFRTGNTVADTLLNMKYHEAVRLVPDLEMDADKCG